MAGLGLITRKDIPCWYELGWRGKVKPPAIIVRIHKEFAEAQGAIPSTAPLVKALQEEFRFSTFSGKIGGKYFGFEKAFRLVSRDDDGFLRYGVQLPMVRRLSDRVCSKCKGRKKDPDFFDSPCLRCKGEGKECEYDWDKAFAVSASFTLFTTWACLCENGTSASV